MTYDARERSAFDGYPIELYTFTRGVNLWRYAANDEDKIITGFTFAGAQIERSKIEQNQDMARVPLTLRMDKTILFLNQFRGSPPTDIVQLTLQRYHEGDGELTTPWVGRVVNVKFMEREAEVRCEPVYTSLRRPTLRRLYQTNCPHVLYSTACGVALAAFRFNTTLTAISGKVITSAAFATKPDGYFSGGFVEWGVGGVIERRFITDHVGQNLTLNLPFLGIPFGAAVSAYPGCDHTLATCASKFANELNYGGQPFYPKKNPMNGTPIY